MPSAVVDAAFKARLSTYWTASPVLVSGETEPSDANAFLVVQYPVTNAEKPVLGNRYFEEGAARLVLNVRGGIGLEQGLVWADTLAGLFRSLRPQDFSGVETFTPSPPFVNDSNDDGNWFEFSVIVPYRYQFAN